ncbi:MAG: Zn-ribbon domain-containing OB-fold protein [Candidatus Dojkabacteria bacterium]
MYRASPSKSWRRYKARYLGSQDGKLLTWSVVHAAPEGFEQYVPYVIAILELKDGSRITTQIVDIGSKELKRGMKFKPAFRKLSSDGDAGVIHYGVKYTPS